MKRTSIIILIILGLSLIVLFFPKNAGTTCGNCPPFPDIHRTEYGCIGLKLDINQNCMDCGRKIVCLGFVTDEKKCYTYRESSHIEIPECKIPSTHQELLEICPDCYEEASRFAGIQNLPKATELCGFLNTIEQKDRCISNLISLAKLSGEFGKAETLCLKLQNPSARFNCLQDLAYQRVFNSDFEGAVSICKKLEPQDTNTCYKSIAIKANKINTTKALEICDKISAEFLIKDCKNTVRLPQN